MKLHHTTKVQAGPDEVWRFLQDTRAVAACLPGAELTDELDGDRYDGVLRIAVGPLKMNYSGRVDVLRRDAAARELEIAAAGRDRRGGGSVRAGLTVGVADAGDGTSRLESVTDLQLTGRIAALGRGVQDVSGTIFDDFTRRLAERVAGGGAVTERSTPPPSAVSRGPEPAALAAPAVAGPEIRLTRLVVGVTRQRLADLLLRWSERVRP
jgi:carbon monoxide dehydrogenase subunit G